MNPTAEATSTSDPRTMAVQPGFAERRRTRRFRPIPGTITRAAAHTPAMLKSIGVVVVIRMSVVVAVRIKVVLVVLTVVASPRIHAGNISAKATQRSVI